MKARAIQFDKTMFATAPQVQKMGSGYARIGAVTGEFMDSAAFKM
jgi:hypothetical protein